MRIDPRQIPDEGLMFIEEFSPKDLDLDTEIIRFLSPVKARVVIRKSYDALSVVFTLSALTRISCGRCLEEKDSDFNREFALNYFIDKDNPLIELDPDIREEIILSYPIKPLCKVTCKGLCPRCGANLNQGGCRCATA